MIYTRSYEIAEVEDYINWIYFFHAWGFPPKYATVADFQGNLEEIRKWAAGFDSVERNAANEAAGLYRDALDILDKSCGKYATHARFGIFEANSDGDDIIIYDTPIHDNDADYNVGECVLPCLRQQTPATNAQACLCLADYIRPAAQGIRDHIGLFATTVDATFENLHTDDNYRHMLCQTLADRLAEATTELMHLQVRRKYWGYASNEHLTKQQLFAEKFQGIRPAIGYPSLPDQSVIFIVDRLLDMQDIGINITESGAMRPHASTCGLIFAHPEARYFSVGKVTAEQAADYARRRKLPLDTVVKFLRSNLTT